MGIPWAAELLPAKDRGEPYSLSSTSLFHDRLCAAHLPRFATVPCPDGARAHPADVRRQEHDVRGGPAPWPLPYRRRDVPWTYVHKGGGRADAQRAKQELLVLCGV